MTHNRLAALALLCLPVVICFAAPKSAKVKRGVSDAARTKLLEQAAKTEAAEAAEAQALAKRVSGALNRSLGSQQKLAKAAAEKHKGYAAYQKELDALVRDLQAKRAAAKSTKDQDGFASAAIDALVKLHEAHRPMFHDILREARLDDGTALKAIASAFGPYGKVQAKSQGDSTFKILLDEPEEAAPPPQTEFTFAPAYAERATSSHTEGLAYDPITNVDLAEGLATASAGPGGAGYQICRAAVAEFVTIPAGFSRLRVTMRGNVTWRYAAFAMGGASSCTGGLRMRVEGFDGFGSTRTNSLGSVLAPVAWWVNDEGDEPFVFSKTFNLPNDDGGEFLVKAGGQAEGWAAVVGGAVGRTSVTVEELQLEALE